MATAASIDDATRSGTPATELAASAADSTLAFNPLVGIRGRDLGTAARAVLDAMRAAPRETVDALHGYAREVRAILAGTSAVAPDPKDRRYADPAWKTHVWSRRAMQLHTAAQTGLSRLLDGSALDDRRKKQAQFLVSLVADALAPSNSPLLNPTVRQRAIATRGASVMAGIRNMIHDVRHNHLLPSQVDAAPFAVGGNVAATPGQVVHRSEMFELIQYAPSQHRVHARPLVLSPPQVNKYYAVDLAPEKSLIKWAVDAGVQMFVISWRNPSAEHAQWGLDDYVAALDEAVDAVRDITHSPDVNMWGICSGGMTLAAYLGWLAARGERKVRNTCWGVCVLDTRAAMNDTTLGLFTSPAAIRAAKARSLRRGMVAGADMARMFAWLRANDLIWNYWVNNYLLGNKPPAFDVLFWNNDTTRLPGRFHADLLGLFETNPFANPGELCIGGLPIDLTAVDVGAYVVGGINDHITPWRACYATARLFGRDATFVLANAGHLQSLVNPPGSPRSFYRAARPTSDDPDAWATAPGNDRIEGSWWPHWRRWIQERSGELVDAPVTLGSAAHPPLGAAPGTYVHHR
jgi:polyhydroxyalkanoate synthase